MNDKSLLARWRFVRQQLSLWLIRVQTLHPTVRGCPEAQSRFMMSIANLNLLGIYDLLDDLIRYPPY